jgi:short-subunit dehydrogenase
MLDTDMSSARHCIEVNVFGTLAMCKAVGRRMAERGSGKIVNIGSVVGYVSTPWAGNTLHPYFKQANANLFIMLIFLGIYCLSKAAIHSMTDTLRMELQPFGVHVMVVAPGKSYEFQVI